MGYSQDDADVRVDFFQPREDGMKWKYTESVRWTGEWSAPSLVDREFAVSLERHLRRATGGHRLRGMIAVCLEPHHQNAFPLAIGVDSALEAVCA